jgi:seryl-tRNA synthetase
MSGKGAPEPGAFGMDALARQIKELRKETKAGFACLERLERKMAGQIEELDAKLDAVAANETKLGEDIRTVITALKNIPNPPPDITRQLQKLDGIAQQLIDTDAELLSNLPPAPPEPGKARR